MKIYSLSNSTQFASKLMQNLRLSSPNIKLDDECITINKQKFADGEINVQFNESIRGEQLVIVAQLQMPYENLFELIITLDAARRSAAKEIILIIPYLIHSRQERRDDKRAPITARVIADILQNAGADRIISMDIHTSAIEGFYSIPFDKLYPFDTIVEKIKSLKIENLKLVSPDFGFMKKMEKYVEVLGCDMAVINKTRKKANEVSDMELIGDVAGHNVVMIDDIIDTATTLCKASDLLIAKGALSVTVFATHGVLSYKDGRDNAELKINNSKIKHAYICNTFNHETLYRYDNETLEEGEVSNKITMLDVSSHFATALLKINKE